MRLAILRFAAAALSGIVLPALAADLTDAQKKAIEHAIVLGVVKPACPAYDFDDKTLAADLTAAKVVLEVEPFRAFAVTKKNEAFAVTAALGSRLCDTFFKLYGPSGSEKAGVMIRR
jgi:hypothetical protein